MIPNLITGSFRFGTSAVRIASKSAILALVAFVIVKGDIIPKIGTLVKNGLPVSPATNIRLSDPKKINLPDEIPFDLVINKEPKKVFKIPGWAGSLFTGAKVAFGKYSKNKRDQKDLFKPFNLPINEDLDIDEILNWFEDW